MRQKYSVSCCFIFILSYAVYFYSLPWLWSVVAVVIVGVQVQRLRGLLGDALPVPSFNRYDSCARSTLRTESFIHTIFECDSHIFAWFYGTFLIEANLGEVGVCEKIGALNFLRQVPIKFPWGEGVRTKTFLACHDQYCNDECKSCNSTKRLHPWNLTWNLKISHWKWRFLLETIIFRFHVKLWGCNSTKRLRWR